jgi:hypothetical protein
MWVEWPLWSWLSARAGERVRVKSVAVRGARRMGVSSVVVAIGI